MVTLRRGAVIEYPTVFSFDSYPRPYVIVSNDAHPYAGEDAIGLAISTTEHEEAVPIADASWIRGGLPRPSFIKPWQPVLLKQHDIVDAFGLLDAPIVDRATRELMRFIK